MKESPQEFLARAGIAYKSKGKEARFDCPCCGESEGFNLNLRTGQWNCLRASCGETGNLYTLAVKLGLAYEVDSPGSEAEPKKRLFNAFQKRPQQDFERWHTLLMESHLAQEARDYLKERKIGESVWITARLGWIPRAPGTGKPGTIEGNGMLTIPFFPPGESQPSMVKLRWIPPEPVDQKGRKRRYQRIAGGESTLYTPIGLEGTRPVLVTGGEIDALSVLQVIHSFGVSFADSPFSVASVPDGEGRWSDLYSEQLAESEDVILCFDNDSAGREGARQVAQAIGSHRCRIGAWPEGANDANEALTSGCLTIESLSHMVDSAESTAGEGVKTAGAYADRVCSFLFRENPAGRSTGWAPVDHLIGGWRDGEITVLTGHSGSGKTTFAIHTLHSQLATGARCLLCPFEGGPSFSIARLLRCHFGKDPATVGEDGVKTALESMGGLLVLDHSGAINVDSFVTTLEYCIVRLGVSFIVADHLHFMVPRGKDRWEKQDELTFRCQMAIQRTSAHMLLLAHPGKVGQGKNRDDVLIQLGDLAGHSALFQDVANVLSTYRPRNAERDDLKDSQGLYPSLIASLKQRQGEYGKEGTVELLVNPEAARFVDPQNQFQRSPL
jgi:hypothetical protein